MGKLRKDQINEKEIVINWNDDHVSNYSIDFLKRNCLMKDSQKERRDSQVPSLWDTNFIVPKVNGSEILNNNEKTIEKWLDDLHNFGISLITDCSTEPGTVVRL